MEEEAVFQLLKGYFKKYDVASLQKRSFDNFLTHRLGKIIEEEPVIQVAYRKNEMFTVEFGQVFVDRPYIIDEKRTIQYILPNEALIRDLTYSSVLSINIHTRHYIIEEDESETMLEEKMHHKIPFARIPVMVGCSKCNMMTLSPVKREESGQCANDPGGYFIIKGKERVLVAQERANHNVVYVFDKKTTDQKNLLMAEIRSMSEETGHSVLIHMKLFTNLRVVVSLPFITQDIPLGFVLVAYGCDISMIEMLLWRNVTDAHTDAGLIIQGIVKDAMIIRDEETAIHHIAQYATHVVGKEKRPPYVRQILMNEVFPHLGISTDKMQKIMFMGHMCGNIIMAHTGSRPLDDRDHLANKRIEMSGVLVGDLFRTLWKRFIRTMIPQLTKRMDILTIISKLNVITMGMRHCFSTGNWGIPKSNYIRAGVSQVLSRMSYNSTISHLRRVVIPIGKEGRNTKIRQVHPTQIGFMCPSETPEGSSAGIVKNFSLIAEVASGFDPILVRMVVETVPGIVTRFNEFFRYPIWIKVMINGNWMGIVEDGAATIRFLECCKETGRLPGYVSFFLQDREIRIFCDEGRMIRPFFVASRLPTTEDLRTKTWDDLVRERKIVWMDAHELENKVVAMFPNEVVLGTTDLCEIHPCLLLGICASMMPFADHTQSPRICYHASMVKQSIGIYSGTNEIRADTVSHVLSYPEKPIVRSHMEEWFGMDRMPCGNNVIVAIACYGGWNQEDSIILNQSSVDRGLFRSSTYRTLVVEEKKKTSSHIETIDIPHPDIRIRSFNYSKLGENGIVKPSVFVGSGDVIVAKTSIRQLKTGREDKVDTSVVIKNGEEGYVDKVFVSTTPEGYKMIKIKIRTLKIPEIGDKLCSNCAQKGTIGMTLPREDMPFTPDGIVPDIIINPLCFPADANVQCADGLSRRIDQMLGRWGHDVWSFCNGGDRIGVGENMGGEHKGIRPLVRMVRADGIDVRCTPDHCFRVCTPSGMSWIPAEQISIGSNRVVCGPVLPEDVSGKDENGWRLGEFCMGTRFDRDRSMALFRLCGLVSSRGGVASVRDERDFSFVATDAGLIGVDNDRFYEIAGMIDPTSPVSLIREWIAGRLSRGLEIGDGSLRWEDPEAHLVGILLVKHWGLRVSIKHNMLLIYDVPSFVTNIGVRYNTRLTMRLTVYRAFLLSGHDDLDQFLLESDANTWYRDDDATLTFWTSTIVAREAVETEEMTYCIGVYPSHCFFAGSMLVKNCIPSRMTINQLMESLGGKSSVMKGRFRYATTFSKHSVDIVDSLKKELMESGFEKNGNEHLINGLTGIPLDAEVFIGPSYYHRLKHLVSAKIHARNHGKVSQLTHQPLEGRSRDGGLRFGEMERDCGSGELVISLNCGLSVKLKAMKDIPYQVFGWDKPRMGMRPSDTIGFINKGIRECVEITLQDGRTIRCTPDHPFLTSDNQWIPAKDLILKTSRLRTSVCFPCVDIASELIECDKWSLFLNGIDLRTDTTENFLRTMAFMRILGWIVTDGGIYQIDNGHLKGHISLGHKMDVDSFLKDLRYFCHEQKFEGSASQFMKTCISSVSGVEWSHYSIMLPHYFTNIISQIEGIAIGKKVCQDAYLPAFVLADDFPRPLLREFLGGMFGGDGHTCILSMHRGKRDVLTSVSFSKSRTKPYVGSLVKMMENMKMLLARCGIHNVTIQNLKETSHSKKKTPSEDDKCYQSTLHIDISELIPFWEKIGFRHCVHKSLRLEAGVSYKRLRDTVTRQHNWLVHRVDEITGFSEIKKQFPNKIVGTKKAIEQAVQELSQRETLVHAYAIPTTHDITDHLVKGTSFGKFTSKSFPNAEEFFKDVGAYHWFVEKDESKNIRGHTCYAIKMEEDVLPTMEMTVVGVRPCGPEEVYDIEVEKTNSFLANGVVAHNCMISHGNSRFLLERLFDMSDPFRVPICNDCGAMPPSNTYCSVCDGTSVSIIPMPYACKLLFQELNAMGVRINLFPERDLTASSLLVKKS